MSNSSSKRFTKITARVLMMLLAACLVLTAAPQLTSGILPVASAEVHTVTGSEVNAINTMLEGYALSDPGCTVNLTLASNLVVSNDSDTCTGLKIPAGITVNLYMNGMSIDYIHPSKADGARWQAKLINCIENRGTLNIYSGTASSPSVSTGAVIRIDNQYKSMDIPNTGDDKGEHAYSRADLIINYGTLTVNKYVNLQATNYLGYKDQNPWGDRGSCTVATTAIYNEGENASCVVDTATISILAESHAIQPANKTDVCHSRAFSYGIYGGDITVNGNTKINISSLSRVATVDGPTGNKQVGGNTTVCYGICSGGDIAVNGGSITYKTSHDCNEAVTEKGTSAAYEGGICYLSTPPTITDCTIDVDKRTDYTHVRGNNKTYREGIVTQAPELPYSGKQLFCSDSTPGTSYGGIYATFNEPATPARDVSAGQYLDEAGNVYSCELNTTDSENGVHPPRMENGATDGTYPVHIIYKYWNDFKNAELNTDIIGNTGFAGYSVAPETDGTDIVKNVAKFSGMTGTNGTHKTAEAGITYVSGGEPYNPYYWELLNFSWVNNFAGEYSDINFKETKGSQFTGTIGAGLSAPIFLFVNYKKLDPTTVKLTAGTAGTAETTYTGSPVLPSSFGIKIAAGKNDYTADYDIDNTGAADKIPVEYSFTGVNAAGKPESGDGLPVNAGTYTVTAKIEDQTAYDKDPVLHKNRYGVETSFTLTVNPAEVSRGSLPASFTAVYGEKFADKLDLNSYKATGIADESDAVVPGVFSFSNAADGNGYKNVGTGKVEITWTPAYSAEANARNYKTTTFNVNYEVTKATLTIIPNAAAVKYGCGTDEFDTPFTVTLQGLAGNDAVNENSIVSALTYMVNVNGNWVSYSAGSVGVGTYPIRATFEGQLPEALKNYTAVYQFGTTDNPYGNLTVSARPVDVKATAVTREYAKDNYGVNVTFEIVSGRYGADDVSVATLTGGVANNNVGLRPVTGIDKSKVLDNLRGGASANYTVGNITYATGDTLMAEITKATPTVSIPGTDERYYQINATLADVAINAATSSVEGAWQWVDGNINPTCNVKTYQAKFVPDDSVNYNEKIVDVPLNIKPTEVTVSYEKTVEYGDKKPNITDLTYKADNDPYFDIEKVDCEGNITVSTTYEQGCAASTEYPVTISTSAYADKAGNYIFTTKNGTIKVAKKAVTFTVQDLEITYGSNFVLNNNTVTVICNENDLYGTDTVNSVTSDGAAPVFTFTSDYSANTNFGAGKYYVDAHENFQTSANYSVKFVRGFLTVKKADLTISAKPMSVEYNTEIAGETLASAYTVTGAKKNETLAQMKTEGEIKVDTTYYKGAPVNAEGYPITIDISDCKFPNYNVTVNNGVVTVTKATPVITALPVASLTHGQKLSDAVFTGGTVKDAVAGTFAFKSPDYSVTYTDSSLYYPGFFIPSDTDNYNTVEIAQIQVTVSKLPVKGELAINGIAMTGETLNADISGLDPNENGVYSFVWKIGGVQVGTGSSYTLTESDVNKEVVLTATANTPYEGVKTATVEKVTPELTPVAQILDSAEYANYFALNGLTAYGQGNKTETPYDGVEHYVNLTLKNSVLSEVSVGKITVKYNGSTAAPVNAGYYKVTVDIGTPEYGDNIIKKDNKTFDSDSNKFVYSPISGYEIGTLYIIPADYTVTLTFNGKVYDGSRNTTADCEESGAKVLAGSVRDDVFYDASSATYTFADANVGNNKAVTVSGAALKGEKACNYNLIITKAGDGTADITPATLKASVEPVSRQYEKDNYKVYLGFSVDTSTLAKTDTTAQVYVDDTNAYGIIDEDNAGTRFVTVYAAALAGSKAGNYVLELTNETGLTVDITKATPSYPIPTTGTVYYDSARTLSEIDLGYDNWAWDESVRNITPTAGTHTYKAIFTPNDTENEATVEYDVKLVVNKAPVTVKITSFSNVIYGDTVPTYGYTVTGLTGTDTIKKSVDGYIVLDSNYTAGSPVGNYTIARTGEFESDNYSFIYESGSITVKPRTVYTTASAVSREYEKGNTDVTVNFTGLDNIYPGDSATVYLENTSVTGTIANDTAGNKKVSYTAPVLCGDKAGNYTLYIYNSNVTVEISKAVITGITFPASGTVSYGQRLSTTVFDEPFDGQGLGTFQMENPTATPEKVGTFNTGYNVIFTPADSVNYAVQTMPIRLVVETAVIPDAAVAISGSTQVGKTLVASIGNVPSSAVPYITYDWYRVDDANDTMRDGHRFASHVDSVTLSSSEQGKYIIAVAVAKEGAPYSVDGCSMTDEQIQASTMSFWQKIINWFYKLISGFTQLFGKK